jgi:tetratricopeptide (TPR) repeat protein
MKKTSVRCINWVKIVLIIVFISGFGLITFIQKESKTSFAQSADRFDKQFDGLVRADFFAGLTGNVERLDRAMKNAEAVLANNPKHAQALVWHGGGVLARASIAYRNGDNKIGDKLWERGLKEMDDAITLAPNRIDVIIGRSATIIGLAQAGWNANDKRGAALLRSALLGYEKVYQEQKTYFSKIDEHSRGELLFGLASGWSILGEHQKSREYLRHIMKEVKGTDYEPEARKWLDRKPAVIEHDCRGCHANRELSY